VYTYSVRHGKHSDLGYTVLYKVSEIFGNTLHRYILNDLKGSVNRSARVFLYTVKRKNEDVNEPKLYRIFYLKKIILPKNVNRKIFSYMYYESYGKNNAK
jgi:hypothetical protein